MLQPYPLSSEYAGDEAAEREIAWVQAFVLAIRQIRGEMDVSPSRSIPVLLKGASPGDLAAIDRHRPWLTRLAALERIEVLQANAPAPPSATALVGDLTLLVPMAGLIDPAAEVERLSRRIAKARQDLAKARAKLANEEFVRNAPAEVVAAERARDAELEPLVARLETHLTRVRALLP